MLVIAVEEAEPGMKLAMSVVHPEHPEQELLKPGFILDRAVLWRLQAMKVPYIYVDYPDLSELDKHLMPYLSPARQKIYNQIKYTIAAVQHASHLTVTFTDYYVATRELVLTLMQTGEHPIYLDLLSGSLGVDAISHATAVAQLSVTMGLRLEQYLIRERSRLPARHAREVVNLGVGAMLHDIGKTRLASDVQALDALCPIEDESKRIAWQAHPAIGADMLRHGVEASAIAAVAHHHQHFDGTGFPVMHRTGHAPKGRVASQIHVYARIILAADLYDHLTIVPGFKRRRWPVEILHILRTQYWEWLDPHILEMLPRIIPPFPPGTRVTLSDQTIAVVTVMDPSEPYYPTVQRIVDGRMKLAGDPIKLSAQSELRIRSLGGVNVEQMVPEPSAAFAT